MSGVDLHVHSTVSDGLLSPAELISRAAEIGLSVIALTDHDSVDGVAAAREAARAFPGLTVIPGVEISTDTTGGETHVLGYYIDPDNPELLVSLERFRDSRKNRAQRMVEKLNGMGVDIEWERVREIAGDSSIGRPHIARAMLEKGYIDKFEDAFNGYIEYGGPAYAEREKMTPEDAVALIIRAGGIPVLAHPFTTGDPEGMAASLKKAGLAGLEAYYHENTPEDTENMLALAEKHGLIVTGGSDFHGDDLSGGSLGGTDVPPAAAQRLIDLGTGRT
ncbi:MAG: PHP domain-containing protein [Dehalococcoidales bacterium]|nr:PHP domain-containing protein [Dehalococcoidales bacterium]